tara:strand:- start:359 stop:481 length:123 start_codon:yes stop_codon:yes gene_type:complete
MKVEKIVDMKKITNVRNVTDNKKILETLIREINERINFGY